MDNFNTLCSNILNIIVENIEQLDIDIVIKELEHTIKNKQLIYEEILQKIQFPPQLLILFKSKIQKNVIHKIDGNDILNCFNNTEWLKNKNLPDILISTFDFDNKDQFLQFIKSFNSTIQLNDKQKYALNFIFRSIQNTNGIFTNFNKLIDCRILLLNSKTYTENTIYHKLIHYFQTYAKYGLEKVKFNTQLPHFDYVDLTEDQIQYYLKHIYTPKEFVTHVDNLIYDLNVLYKTYYKDSNEKEFILNFINIFSSKNKQMINNSDIYKQWIKLKLSKLDLNFYIILKNVSTKLWQDVNNKLLKEQI